MVSASFDSKSISSIESRSLFFVLIEDKIVIIDIYIFLDGNVTLDRRLIPISWTISLPFSILKLGCAHDFDSNYISCLYFMKKMLLIILILNSDFYSNSEF